MKAKDLKVLISTIPDEDDVGYTYTDSDGDTCYCDDFTSPKRYHGTTWTQGYTKINGYKIWLITNASECIEGLISEKQCLFETARNEFIASFPIKPKWTIKLHGSMLKVRFDSGYIEHEFTISYGKDRWWFYNLMNKSAVTDFTNWDDYFAIIIPFLKKELQKKREELESLVEDFS